METYFSSRLRSSHLLTRIISYLGTFNQVTSLLRLLSKKGSFFLEANRGQISYFCSHAEDLLDLSFDGGEIILISKQRTQVHHLNIKSQKHIETLFDYLQNIRTIKSINIYPDNSNQLMEQFITNIVKTFELIKRTSNLTVSAEKVPAVELSFANQYSPNYQQIMNLNLVPQFQKFDEKNKVPSDLLSQVLNIYSSIDHLSKLEIKIQQNNNNLKQLLCNISQQNLEAFSFASIQQFSMPFSFKKEMHPLMSQLKALSLHHVFDYLGAQEQMLTSLQQLKKLDLKLNYFNFDTLSQLPNLKKLELICSGFYISEKDTVFAKELTKLKICFTQEFESKHIELLLGSIQKVKKVHLKYMTSHGHDVVKIENLVSNANELEFLRLKEVISLSEKNLRLINSIGTLKLCKLKFDIPDLSDLEVQMLKPFEFPENHVLQELSIILNYNKLQNCETLMINLAAFICSFKSLKRLEFNEKAMAVLQNKDLILNLMARENGLDFYMKKENLIALDLFLISIPVDFIQCLKNLDVSHYYLQEASFNQILTALQDNSNLQTLKIGLRESVFVKICLAKLFKAVKVHKRIKSLYICHYFDLDFITNIDLEHLILDNCEKLRVLRFEDQKVFINHVRTKERPGWNAYRQRIADQVKEKFKQIEVFVI